VEILGASADLRAAYEAGVNRTYQDLAAHYGTTIMPTRPRKPRDKAKVVPRKKLRAVDGKALATLAKTDELELLYLHLYSMRNFNDVKNRLIESASPEAEPAQTEAAALGRVDTYLIHRIVAAIVTTARKF
jgi:hypothetical protein